MMLTPLPVTHGIPLHIYFEFDQYYFLNQTETIRLSRNKAVILVED